MALACHSVFAQNVPTVGTTFQCRDFVVPDGMTAAKAIPMQFTHVSTSISPHRRPVLRRCADALLSAGRHEPAVHLLLKGRQPERALDLLVTHEVPLSEELAEALTPEKTADNADSRSAVLLRIAQVSVALHNVKEASGGNSSSLGNIRELMHAMFWCCAHAQDFACSPTGNY